MSRKHWKRADAIERLRAGKMTQGEVASVLSLSLRQVRRLLRAFEKRGAAGLLHGNVGRRPGHRTEDDLRRKVVELMNGKYAGFNDQHFTEMLAEFEGIVLGRQTVRRILRQAGIKAARRRRPRVYRHRRQRRAQEGLMLLWDGSLHDWLEGRGPVLCLMGAVDDATGALMPGAHFIEHEGTSGYLRVLLAVAQAKGLPLSIYMDRHGSLHRNDPHWTLEEELRGEQDPTQVGAALRELGIEAIYALSPEAKGRVERLWGTLQDRLCSELRLAGAATLEQANAVLARFLSRYNARFAKEALDAQPAWRKAPRELDLASVCSYRLQTKVDRTNFIGLKHLDIQVPPGPGGRSYAGRRADVRLLLDGRVRVYIGGQLVAEARRQPPRHAPRRNRPQQKKAKTPTKPKLTFNQVLAKHRGRKRTESLAS